MSSKISRSHRLVSIFTAIVLGCASAPLPPPSAQNERGDILPDGAVDGGPVDEEAVPIVTVQPRFPEQARQLGESGRVEVQVVVDERGVPGGIIVVRSSPDFDDAVVDAVRQWRFKPARRYGQPIAVRVRIPMDFHW